MADLGDINELPPTPFLAPNVTLPANLSAAPNRWVLSLDFLSQTSNFSDKYVTGAASTPQTGDSR